MADCILIAVTEMNRREDIDLLVEALAEVGEASHQPEVSHG
jgi:hypothetical protein